MTINHLRSSLDLDRASQTVTLPASTVDALVEAGHLVALGQGGGEVTYRLPEVEDGLDPEELLSLLDERAEHMSMRLLKMYSTVFPPAAQWDAARQADFVRRAKSRFEAMLAVAALGDRRDDSLEQDLRSIGADTARRGVKLPQVMLLLRISRDLVVQNAIDLAGSREGPGGFALSLLLTRILPALDRMGDALTAGYWEAMFPI